MNKITAGKLVGAGLLVSLFALGVFPAHAQENSSLLANLFSQIESLREIVSSLRAQIYDITGGSGTPPAPGTLSPTTQNTSTAVDTIYIGVNPQTSFRVGGSPRYQSVEQTFTLPSTKYITDFSVALAQFRNPSFPIVYSIVNPNGVAVSTGTFTPSNISSRVVDPTWVDISLNISPKLSAGTYKLILSVADEYAQQSTRSFYRWAVDRTDPYAGGELSLPSTGGTYSKIDALAKILVVDSVGGPPPVPPSDIPLDVDQDGDADENDVTYISRHLLGTPPVVPPSHRTSNPNIPSDAVVTSNIMALGNELDVDANGQVDVATDMVYINRRITGLVPTVPQNFRELDSSIPLDSEINVRIDVISGAKNIFTISPVSNSSRNIIMGRVNAELGTFTLDATNSSYDLLVTQAQIFADVTDMDIDGVSNLKLFYGSTPLNAGSNVVNPAGHAFDADTALTFTFDAPGLTVPRGTSVTLILKGNPATSIPQGSSVKFDFSGGNQDWTVINKASLSDVSEYLSSTPGTLNIFHENGGWTVSLAPSVPTEKWVAAGVTGVHLNTLRIAGTNEEFALTNLRLKLADPASAADFAKMYLYDGATLVQTKIPSFINGVEDFTFPTSGIGSLTIPKNGYKDLVIKADISKIGASEPGIAGMKVAVDFDGRDATKNKALGLSSGSSIPSSTLTSTVSNGIRYFRSVPTIERVVIPETTLTSGNHVLYKFKANTFFGDVGFHKFTFSVATTGVVRMSAALPNFTLWNVEDSKRVGVAVGTSASYLNDPNNYDGNKDLLVRIYADTADYSNSWVTVPSFATFELRADITTDGSGDSVTTKLLGDSISYPQGTLQRYYTMTSASQVDAVPSNFIWTDFSSDATTTHTLNTADWMNGYKVPGLLSTGLDSSTLSN